MTLKGIDPLLNGELLQALDELGHGDLVVIAERNFPAHSQGTPVIRVDAGVVETVRAILTVLPLDTLVPTPIERMIHSDEDPRTNAVQEEVLAVATESAGTRLSFRDIPRLSFYDRAAQGRVVVLTREPEPYCDFVLIKGVV